MRLYITEEEAREAIAGMIPPTPDEMMYVLSNEDKLNGSEGMSIGLCFGVAISTALHINVGLGMMAGMVLGYVIGSLTEKNRED